MDQIRRVIKGTQRPAARGPASPKPVDGIFFGTVGTMQVTRPMREDGHVLVIGGTKSGKSSCIAIPTLKTFWPGRVLAIDIKGELSAKS